MKVLFVCRGNVGRSQMAQAYYNFFTKTTDASSAGTHVEKPGQTLDERQLERPGASFAVQAMAEEGIDTSEAKTKQLSKDMLDNFDLIVNMAAKRYTPKWLSNSSIYVYWDVRDPMGRNREVTIRARNNIKHKVKTLINI